MLNQKQNEYRMRATLKVEADVDLTVQAENWAAAKEAGARRVNSAKLELGDLVAIRRVSAAQGGNVTHVEPLEVKVDPEIEKSVEG